MIVVTGAARSGTSMMMRMLERGGVSVLTDNHLLPNEHNPHGFYEHLESERFVLENPTRDAAVKILAYSMPQAMKNLELALRGFPQFIVMRRDPEVSAASWRKMVGKERSAEDVIRIVAEMDEALGQHRRLDVRYDDVVVDPTREIERIVQYLGRSLNTDRMLSVVDASLDHGKVLI